MSLDLALSVASGTPFLSHYACPAPGPVLMFVGEGGKRKAYRRMQGIARHKGIDLAQIPLHLSFVAPTLTSDEILDAIAVACDATKPVLAVVDPFYLSAGGANLSRLTEVGELLRQVQDIVCTWNDAALCMVHHWNKSGEGGGSDRFSGVGLAEWGRVLLSLSAVGKTKIAESADGRTTGEQVLQLELEGDEVVEATAYFRRAISSVRDDLNSAMTYHVALTDAPAEGEEERPSKGTGRRVMDRCRDENEFGTVEQANLDERTWAFIQQVHRAADELGTEATRRAITISMFGARDDGSAPQGVAGRHVRFALHWLTVHDFLVAAQGANANPLAVTYQICREMPSNNVFPLVPRATR